MIQTFTVSAPATVMIFPSDPLSKSDIREIEVEPGFKITGKRISLKKDRHLTIKLLNGEEASIDRSLISEMSNVKN